MKKGIFIFGNDEQDIVYRARFEAEKYGRYIEVLWPEGRDILKTSVAAEIFDNKYDAVIITDCPFGAVDSPMVKRLITEDKVFIDRKYKDGTMEQNNVKWIFCVKIPRRMEAIFV